MTWWTCGETDETGTIITARGPLHGTWRPPTPPGSWNRKDKAMSENHDRAYDVGGLKRRTAIGRFDGASAAVALIAGRNANAA